MTPSSQRTDNLICNLVDHNMDLLDELKVDCASSQKIPIKLHVKFVTRYLFTFHRESHL